MTSEDIKPQQTKMRRFRSILANVLNDIDVNRLSPEALKKKLEPIYKMTSELSLQELGLTKPLATDGRSVGYVPMLEEENFTVGIFIIPPGVRIPLHDHPEMCVVSRLLYGRLQVVSLDWDNSIALKQGKHYGGEAKVISNQWIEAPNTQILLPNDCNLHEFRASNQYNSHGCAILDIITPNYSDEKERPCTYYRVETENRDTELKHPSSSVSELYEGDVVTLQPIPQPRDFAVFTHPFRIPQED